MCKRQFSYNKAAYNVRHAMGKRVLLQKNSREAPVQHIYQNRKNYGNAGSFNHGVCGFKKRRRVAAYSVNTKHPFFGRYSKS